MVIVDSSALIPLARVDRLGLITTRFDTVETTVDVRSEVLVEGKPGTAVLESFLASAIIHDTPSEAEHVSTLEGIAVADASVILLAAQTEDVLLANDRALIEVARIHGVDPWWVTTLLIACTKDGTLSSATATDVCYDLVEAGMNLEPTVYTRIQRTLRSIGTGEDAETT